MSYIIMLELLKNNVFVQNEICISASDPNLKSIHLSKNKHLLGKFK